MPLPLSDLTFASAADRAACRAMIRTGSKSFAAASLLLPKRLREDAYALYAFCRLSDDLIDIEGGALDAIARLRDRLDRAYRGRPIDSPVDRSFADVVAYHALPRDLPEALIDGLEWDVRGFACDTMSDVFAYSARVAGSVGAMMAVLMGSREPDQVARACDLGVAMQLTNIARDVGEDARAGRLYLPRDWLREAGIEPQAWLARPVMSPDIAAIVGRLLGVAGDLYARAEQGIARLPLRCRPGIFAARRIYGAIGADVAAHGYDSLSRRARVSGRRKIGLAMRAMADAAPRRGGSVAAPPLPETSYLVDAVAHSRDAIRSRPTGVSERIVWVAELFAELKLRERVS